MKSFHHRNIKRFDLDGNIHDDAIIGRLKEEYIRLLTSQMRLAGYIPRLDIDPDFTIEYNEITEYFEFKLSTYGIYVGKKQSECILGIDGTKALHIQQNKSNVSSQAQV